MNSRRCQRDNFFYQKESWISRQKLLALLRSGVEGEWWIDGLGPLAIRGEARLGGLLIVHGAGAGQDSVFLDQLRYALAEAGVQTLAMEFAYLQQMRREARRRPPPRIDRLVEGLARWCETVPHNDLPPLWIGGKSMGGRAASLLAARDAAAGLVFCAYSFHPPGFTDMPAWRQVDECPMFLRAVAHGLGQEKALTLPGTPVEFCAT